MVKELLFSITKKDFTVTTFRSSGPGGQHRNKTDSGVRILHKDSGTLAQSCDTRSQLQNRKIAFQRLLDSQKFKIWHKRKIWEIVNKVDPEKEFKKSIEPHNFKIEVKDEDGDWKKVKTKELKE